MPVLKDFYRRVIAPEILTRKIENCSEAAAENAAKTYACTCRTVHNDGDDKVWIGCDSKDCKTEWFHLASIGLKRVPKKEWYCKDCKKSKKSKKNQ